MKGVDNSTYDDDDPLMIPRQWLSPSLRWILRAAVLPFVMLDICAQRIATWAIPPPQRRQGRCGRCGKCCHYILIRTPRSFLGRLNLLWNTQVNGFYLRGKGSASIDGEEMMVMSCRYLLKGGRCAIHFFRPLICRQWPRLDYFGSPQITEGCCYEVKKREK